MRIDNYPLESLKEKIDLLALPTHIAIIMDGNGRWARQQGEERIFGHNHGVNSVRNAAEACAEIGVKNLTLYAFSTENWNRPKEEVDALMSLLVHTISGELPTLHKNEIALKAIGNLEQLPKACSDELQKAMAQTAHHSKMNLILALSYSAKWDIMNAVKKIATEYKSGNISLDEISSDSLRSKLSTAAFPDPELMIRTSGEHRISNFLLWELAYAEFFFHDVLWPDFSKEHLYEAILAFQKRERRFGLTSEQISK